MGEFEFAPATGSDTVTLEEAVFQALGAASTCWSETPAGVFDSDRAKQIGDALVAFVREHFVARLVDGPTYVAEIFDGEDGDTYWRFRAENAAIVGGSVDGYKNAGHARLMLEQILAPGATRIEDHR
jgi:hypothetical protein